MRACGIDPGTSRWGFYAFEESETILDRSIQTSDWNAIQNQLEELYHMNLDVVAAPSGYGLPLKLLRETSNFEQELITLWSGEGRIGIKKSLEILKDISCNVFVIPGVKHLSSVPAHRKINRLDLGTPDKVCTVAYSMDLLQNELNIPYRDMNFILVELGAGFNAFLRIMNGTIVDGIGGSNASFGCRSGGALDSEVAYLIGQIRKKNVFEGGILSGVENFLDFKHLKQKTPILWSTFIEAIIKDIARLDAIGPGNNLVVLSGNLTRDSTIVEYIQSVISQKTVKCLPMIYEASHAAVGAAYIAEGLQKGKYKGLVTILGLQNSSGTSIDGILYQSIKKNSLLKGLRDKIED